MKSNESNGFNYTYSAKEQADLKRIREKYLADSRTPEISKMEQLRRLDSGVTQKATVISLILGITGTLTMGFGMSLIMSELQDLFFMSSTAAMTVGIAVGMLGMAAVLLAYPLYHYISEKSRKKIAPEILRLTDELLNEKKH